MKRKSRQIVGVQLPCGAKAQSLNIIIRIASPNIAEQVLTFYGWYNQISSMKASASGCEMHLHHLIYVCFRSTHAAKQNILRLWSSKFSILITDYSYEFFNNRLWLDTLHIKSRCSYGNSALFLQRSQSISLDFYVLKKSQNGKCSS